MFHCPLTYARYCICWKPRRCKIGDNELADAAAKRDATGVPTLNAIHYTDYWRVIGEKIREKWREEWRKSKDKLKEIKDRRCQSEGHGKKKYV